MGVTPEIYSVHFPGMENSFCSVFAASSENQMRVCAHEFYINR